MSVPQLYIILIRPERNVRQSMMPNRHSTTKSSAVTGTNASSMMAPITLTAVTCDQNKTVQKHVTTKMDCSTQSECEYLPLLSLSLSLSLSRFTRAVAFQCASLILLDNSSSPISAITSKFSIRVSIARDSPSRTFLALRIFFRNTD